jgi:signal transduction histidine kinase
LEAANGTAWVKKIYHPYYEENMLLVAVPLIQAEGQSTGTVLINAPLADFDDFLNRIYWYIAAAGAVGLLLTVLIANYLSASIIRPLRSMRAVASAMANGDYSVQAKVETNDEVGDLSKSLNLLAKALSEFVSKTEKTDKLRRDFVANVSHELRTPLTIMRGYNEALLDGTISQSDQVEKYHRVMRDESIRLQKLINELLDLSHLEARTAALETEQVSLAEIVSNLVTLFKQPSQEKGVELETKIAEGLPEIQANGDRLTQLVLILLDNALKFTPAGGTITISVGADDQTLTLRVADTGEGISPEDLPNVWERFYKADKSHARAAGGTGLGLAIAKEIINLHGAKVDVASQLGKGTVFSIMFAIKKVSV